jgi:hypothetical protein
MLPATKRISIANPDELDREAAAGANRQGISKSELICRGSSTVLPEPRNRPIDDRWRRLAGFASEGVTTSRGEIDEVAYKQ